MKACAILETAQQGVWRGRGQIPSKPLARGVICHFCRGHQRLGCDVWCLYYSFCCCFILLGQSSDIKRGSFWLKHAYIQQVPVMGTCCCVSRDHGHCCSQLPAYNAYRQPGACYRPHEGR